MVSNELGSEHYNDVLERVKNVYTFRSFILEFSNANASLAIYIFGC